TTIIEEVEENNLHEIVNSPAGKGHVRGVYRWLTKVSEAEGQRYGQRMVVEGIVPEPAAVVLYAMVEDAPANVVLEKPEPPTYFGAPLRPIHLTRSTYQAYVAQYQPAGVEPPPARHVTLAHTHAANASDEGLSIIGHSTKLTVPEGYEAYAADVQLD